MRVFFFTDKRLNFGYNETGMATIFFTAADEEYSTSDDAAITVIQTNTAPEIINLIDDLIVEEDNESMIWFNLNDVFADPDETPLNFSVENDNPNLVNVSIRNSADVFLEFLIFFNNSSSISVLFNSPSSVTRPSHKALCISPNQI